MLNASSKRKDDTTPENIEKLPDGQNANLISLYNKPHRLLQKNKSNKLTNKYILLFGMKSSSILSNEDVEITFSKTKKQITLFPVDRITYNINIKNKTNKILYIDKAYCFKTFNGENSYNYLNNEQVTINKGSHSGGAIGLGGIMGALNIGGAIGQIGSGISVGGGRMDGTSTTYTDEKIIAIPPMGNRNLRDEKIEKVTNGNMFKSMEFRVLNKAEVLDFTELRKEYIGNPGGGNKVYIGKEEHQPLGLSPKMLSEGNCLSFNEENTPYIISYFITYSTESDFKTYSTMKFELYLKDIIGCKKYRSKNWSTGKSKILSNEYIDGMDKYTIEGYEEIE